MAFLAPLILYLIVEAPDMQITDKHHKYRKAIAGTERMGGNALGEKHLSGEDLFKVHQQIPWKALLMAEMWSRQSRTRLPALS